MKKRTPKGRFWALWACVFWGWGAGLVWRSMTAPPLPNTARLVRLHIPTATPANAVIGELEHQGIIRSGWMMRLWVKFKEPTLQAGSYEFSQEQSLGEVFVLLGKGVAATNRITIPEGWSVAQVGQYLANSGYFPIEKFTAATAKDTATYWPDWLPGELKNLEGFLYPDTYEIPLDGATPELVVKIMTDRFAEVALPLHRSSTNSKLSLKDWVTLGSIVEKEAVLAEERPTIAGVFWQRLQIGMRLESDPTVEYALNYRQTQENPLTLAQVRTPSPYNTYLNEGLPPGPIASPGVSSLQAALNPPATEFLFFVARYDGTHIFSRTLEEHEQSIQKIAEKSN